MGKFNQHSYKEAPEFKVITHRLDGKHYDIYAIKPFYLGRVRLKKGAGVNYYLWGEKVFRSLFEACQWLRRKKRISQDKTTVPPLEQPTSKEMQF
jgi:hypothetical protein